jgi:ATP-dependent helicase/DNAse subunit B
LDAGFICRESPFEKEPERSLDLSAHKYSASQLATYLTCPRRFFYEKLLRIAPERPEDFGLGELIHRVLEQFHATVKHFSAERAFLEDALLKVFFGIWHGDPAGSEEQREGAFYRQYPTALQRETIRRRSEDILRRYVRTEMSQSYDNEIIECEKNIDFLVGDYPFVARIDRIDAVSGGHYVIDHKTSASGPMGAKTIKKKFLNVDDDPAFAPQDFQLPLYMQAARSAGFKPVKLMYYWLARETAAGMFKKSSLDIGDDAPDSLSDDEIKTIEETIVDIVGQICEGEFASEPKASYECTRCSFDFMCDVLTENGEQNES